MIEGDKEEHPSRNELEITRASKEGQKQNDKRARGRNIKAEHE